MKKVLSVLLASAAALSVFGGLTACTTEDTNVDRKPDTITIWAPTNSIGSKVTEEGYASMIDGFKTAYPEFANFKYEFVAMGEGSVQGNMGNNPRAGAEVFFFASDHFGNMIHNNYLQPLNITDSVEKVTYESMVKTRDHEGTVEFVTENDHVYAFPATNDNGYFLWYDSSVLEADDVKDLDTLMAKAKAAKKQISFPYTNSWYAGSFLFGVGCKFNYTDNTLTHYKGDFNTPEAYAAGKAMLKYAQSANNSFEDGNVTKKVIVSPESFAPAFATGELCAAIALANSYADIENAFKAKFEGSFTESMLDKFEATVLPTYDYVIDGATKTTHMGTFYGGKYCGVNGTKSEEKIKASLALANWFTNADGQRVRFEADYSGPSNKVVAQEDAVQSNKGLKAYNDQVNLQVAHVTEGINCVQGVQSDAFWGDSGISQFATGVFQQEDGFKTEKEIETKLDALAAGLNF